MQSLEVGELIVAENSFAFIMTMDVTMKGKRKDENAGAIRVYIEGWEGDP